MILFAILLIHSLKKNMQRRGSFHVEFESPILKADLYGWKGKTSQAEIKKKGNLSSDLHNR